MPSEQEIEDEADRAAAAALGANAVLQVRHAGMMTAQGRDDIAEWLHHQALMLIADGSNYAVLFTARYNPDEDSAL